MQSITENEHIIHLWDAMIIPHWFIAAGIIILLFTITGVCFNVNNGITIPISIISFVGLVLYIFSCLIALGTFYSTNTRIMTVNYAKRNVKIIRNKKYNIKHHSRLSIKYGKKYYKDNHDGKTYLAKSYKVMSKSESQAVLNEHRLDMKGLHKVKAPTFKNYVIPQYFHSNH